MRRASHMTLIAAAMCAVLVVGGVHSSTVAIVATFGLFAAGFQVVYLHRRDHHSVYISSVGIALLLAAAVSFLQLIPVPEWVHRLLSPHGWEIVATGFDAAGLSGVGWRPLSMEPIATADRALRFTALALFSVAGANVYKRHAWRPAARVVIGLGIVTALIGAALYTTGAKTFLGFYESEVGFRAPGTFINTNQGAAFYGFAAIVAIALGIDARVSRRKEAVFAGVCAVVFLALCLVHDSEGTNLALIAAALAAAVLVWWRAGRPTSMQRPTLVAVGGIVALALVLAIWLDVDLAVRNYLDRVIFGGEHGNRLEVVTAGLQAVGDFWPAGAGMGAVESVIPAYIDWGRMTPASIPVLENDTVEILMGAGIFLGLPILAMLIVTPLCRVRAAVDPSRSLRFVLAVVGAFYLAIVAQMHFPLFAVGLGGPIIAYLEVAWSRRMRPSEGETFFRSGHLRLRPWVAGTALVVLAVGLVVSVYANLEGYRVELEKNPSDQQASRMLRMRPAEHRVYVRLATAAAVDGEVERAVRLARIAFQREPSPRVRLFVARALALHDESEAVEEYRRLFETVAPTQLYLDSLLADVDDPDTRADLVSGHPERWFVIANQIRAREGAEPASSFVVALVGAHPASPRAYRVAARLYMKLGEVTLARLWAELLMELEQQLPHEQRSGAVLLAKALAAEGRRDEAQRLLSKMAREGAADEVHRYALRLRGTVGSASEEDVDDVREHYEKLCQSPIPKDDLEICWSTEAWLAEWDGDFTEARRAYQRLYRRFDQPVTLASFYLRHQRCRRLEALGAQLEPGSRAHKRVEGMLSRCEPAFE